jgi:hypothetical protein
MQRNHYQCTSCDHSFDLYLTEALISLACPPRRQSVRLVRAGMNLRLTLGEALFLVAAGYALFHISKTS